MIRCSIPACLLALLVLPVDADDRKAASEQPDGLTSIFNGKDLSGWDGDERLWSVKDGVIHGETTAENKANGNTFLIWKDGQTKDFRLEISFRCNATNNSGIQYRSKHFEEGRGIRNKWVVRGYQHEIRNQNELPSVSCFIYDEGGRRGRIILVGQKGVWSEDKLEPAEESLVSAKEYKKLFKLDEWNDVVIVAKGNHIQHYMNGKLVLDFTDSESRALTEGVLALQLHAGKPMWVEFKDIRFKALN